jgi:hypothetical protein
MPSTDPGTGPLAAVIEYQGNTYRYEEQEGVDLGDYVDPQNRFVQSCRRTTNERLPLTVFFRPDRGTHRAEVVFELGRLRPKSPPANLEAYQVTILRGDRVVFTAKVPQHYWFSRWRWQSSPRPITTKVSDLIARGLLPPYDGRATNGTARQARRFSYQIMELAGITPVMPMTGERDDIGPVTEVQAEFVCTGNEAALATLLAQAEGAGTCPWYYRDEATGAPLDVIRYPKASKYGPNVSDPYIATTKTPIQLDTNHEPALAYLPFMLTGDPYHLETMQFQVTFDYIVVPGPARFVMGQPRGQAWLLRTLAQAATVTPESTPQWLMRRGYFQQLLNAKRDWINRTFVMDPSPEHAIIRTVTEGLAAPSHAKPFDRGTFCAPWQDEFLAFIFCWIVQMGHPDWRAIAQWKIGSCTARTNGRSGWNRAYPTPYILFLKASGDAPIVGSWSEAWTLNDGYYHWPRSDPDQLSILKGGDIVYPMYTRGALAMATRLDFPEAKACYNWLDGQLIEHLRGGIRADYKWSVVA